jgi:hypothetical protein
VRVAVIGKGVTRLDVRHILPLDEHVCFADGVGLIIQLLAECREPRLGIMLMHPFPRDRKHSARTGCRVINCPDHAGFREHIIVFGEDQVDHEPDDLAGREVFAGRLVGEFGELADELLEDGTHIGVAHLVRVQVDLAELFRDKVEQVGVGKPINLCFQLEAGEDVFHVRGEAVQVRRQIGSDIILVADDGL